MISQKHPSDDTFAVETSMEGIHYDAEKEDVTLVRYKMRMVESIIQTKNIYCHLYGRSKR